MILEFGRPDESAVIAAGTNAGCGGVERDLAHWDGPTLVQALTKLRSVFANVAPSLDSINVFPVADGDTGINMLATIAAATQAAVSATQLIEPSSAPITAKAVLDAAAEGALDGARGNSGVILSQFFAGLASVGIDRSLDALSLSIGLGAAARSARMAVASPVEGTIITVMEAAASGLAEIDPQGLTIGTVLDLAAGSAVEALMRTPGQLPVLARAGVVDAGGYGFVAILGALRAFAYRPTESELGDQLGPYHSSISVLRGSFRDGSATHDVGAAYVALEGPACCINFMLSGSEYTIDVVRERFASLGDSLVVVGTQDRMRVHLHSAAVESVVLEARRLGSISLLQVDEIVEHVVSGRSATDCLPSVNLGCASHGRLLSLACAPGAGLERALREMGATLVLPVPRTTLELARLKSEMCSLTMAGADVVLLPNDAALIEAFRELIPSGSAGKLHIIETSSVPQGIAALAALQPGLDASQKLSRMRSASLDVKTLVVVSGLLTAEESGAPSVANARGFLDGELITQGADPAAVLVGLIEASETEDDQLLSIFYGQSVGSALLGTVERRLRERFPALAVELLAGGQVEETFIAALE